MVWLVLLRKAQFVSFLNQIFWDSFIPCEPGFSVDIQHSFERCLNTILPVISWRCLTSLPNPEVEDHLPCKRHQQTWSFFQGVLKRHSGCLAQHGFCFLSPSNDEPDVLSARLLFCHCQQATDLAQPCRRTAMEQPLTLLNIHRHLKLMGAPLVVGLGKRSHQGWWA